MDPKTTEIIEGLKSFKRENDITRMVFFGSRRNGQHTKYSDVDLIVVSPVFQGLKSFRRSPLLRRKWKMDYPVDMLCYTPREFEIKKRQPTIVRQAVQDGIEI